MKLRIFFNAVCPESTCINKQQTSTGVGRTIVYMPHVTRISLMAAIHQSTSQKKGGRKRNEINLIYANPLPITFSRIENRFAVTALGIFGISPTQVLNPRCEGTFDPITRSVWITNSRDSMILWRRGFFGKGNLSRREPSWLVRQSQLRATSGRRKHNNVYMWLHVLMVTLFRGNLRGGDSEAPS